MEVDLLLRGCCWFVHQEIHKKIIGEPPSQNGADHSQDVGQCEIELELSNEQCNENIHCKGTSMSSTIKHKTCVVDYSMVIVLSPSH